MFFNLNKYNRKRRYGGPRGRGFTLVELLVALTVLAIVSVAVFTMLAGALNTERYLRGATSDVSQLELACRRITHHLRTASAVTAPTTVTPQASLTLTSQPDAANNGAIYAVSYALVGHQLKETHTRYGTNVIADNVASFTVARVSANDPKNYIVTVTTNGKPAMTRQYRVGGRNL